MNSDNSSLLCGEIVVMALQAANDRHSFMREYRKKFYEIVADNGYHLMRLIISSYTVPIDKPVTSSNLQVVRS